MELPPMEHIGMVVHDVDKTVEHFTKIGLGPFHVSEADAKGFVYHGKEVRHRVKLAFSSSTPKLELIQILDAESPNADFLNEKGEGITHVGFRVDLRNFDEILADLARAGVEPIFHRLKADLPVAYLNSDKIGGMMIELIGVKKTD